MELEPLSSDFQTAVLQTVNETGNRLHENRGIIQQWIQCQPHLPGSSFDERILNLFLRGCKHDLERTKKKLDMYFTCRSMYPDLFENRDPFCDEIQQALESLNMVPLPKPSFDGYRITIHRFGSTDASNYDLRFVLKAMFMIGDIRLVEEPPIVGDIFLFDLQNITASHFAKLFVPVMKNALFCVQEGYPQRLKEIHLFNAPPLVDKIVSFFKQFLKEKMRNRFFIHTSVETIYEYIPRSHLPCTYGGDLKSLAELQSFWNKKLKSYKHYFEQQESVKSDESKRPKGSNRPSFGCDGAFRKLDID